MEGRERDEMIRLKDIRKVFGKGSTKIVAYSNGNLIYEGLVRDMPTDIDYYYVVDGNIIDNRIEAEVE